MSSKLAVVLLAVGLAVAVPCLAGGYQRSRSYAPPHVGPMHTQGGAGGYRGAAVAGSYFQRPYPYHLDYYRMRYGGSYAPYFGNQYGVPQVYAPAYGYPTQGFGYGGPVHQVPYAQPGVVE